jgi:hypothetical protein
MSGRKEEINNVQRDINKGSSSVLCIISRHFLSCFSHRPTTGKQLDLTAMAAKSPHTVTALLKLYFRELKPEPLLTFNLYECLLAGTCSSGMQASPLSP